MPSHLHRAEFRPDPFFRRTSTLSPISHSQVSPQSFNIKHDACISAAETLAFPFFTFSACQSLRCGLFPPYVSHRSGTPQPSSTAEVVRRLHKGQAALRLCSTGLSPMLPEMHPLSLPFANSAGADHDDEFVKFTRDHHARPADE